eukprot:scaffold195580_cov17-Tisochrysis_lutea.AAC.3
MAFFLAMVRVPKARQVVITAGRPSGMAATARATWEIVSGQGALQDVMTAGWPSGMAPTAGATRVVG